jgi:hypothetical protein
VKELLLYSERLTKELKRRSNARDIDDGVSEFHFGDPFDCLVWRGTELRIQSGEQ